MAVSRLIGVVTLFGWAAGTTTGVAAPVPKDLKGRQPEGEVRVVGVYEGAYPPGVGHGGGVHPTGTVTLKVGPVKKPVVLVLTAYEPVVWKIDAAKGAVVKVITSGYHRQTVEGVGQQVPVTRLAFKDGDKDYFFAYRKGGEGPNARDQAEAERSYDRLVRRVKELTGQEVKGFQGAYSGRTFEVR